MFFTVKKEEFDSLPFFVSCNTLEVYSHVAIKGETFQKAVSLFAKFIQQQLYFLAALSRKETKGTFFLS